MWMQRGSLLRAPAWRCCRAVPLLRWGCTKNAAAVTHNNHRAAVVHSCTATSGPPPVGWQRDSLNTRVSCDLDGLLCWARRPWRMPRNSSSSRVSGRVSSRFRFSSISSSSWSSSRSPHTTPCSSCARVHSSRQVTAGCGRTPRPGACLVVAPSRLHQLPGHHHVSRRRSTPR